MRVRTYENLEMFSILSGISQKFGVFHNYLYLCS